MYFLSGKLWCRRNDSSGHVDIKPVIPENIKPSNYINDISNVEISQFVSPLFEFIEKIWPVLRVPHFKWVLYIHYYRNEGLVPHKQFFYRDIDGILSCASYVLYTHDVIDDITMPKSMSNFKIAITWSVFIVQRENKYCQNMCLADIFLSYSRFCSCFVKNVKIHVLLLRDLI